MSLETVWFVLIAVLWSGYFVLEGFDFGVGMLLPFLPRDERERGTMFESIGPFWDGNEVWLVVAGGATFAAFPAWYATVFSGFYVALLLILVLLIVRVLSFEWRARGESSRWRSIWMWANTIGSVGASLIWGVALANFIHGVPINSSGDYAGTFWDLFSPYTVFAGLAVVALFAFHGAVYTRLRTVGDLCARAGAAARRLAVPAAALAAALMAWTVAVAVDLNERGALGPAVTAAMGIVALLLALAFVWRDRTGWAFGMTTVATIGVVATIFTGLYPRVLVATDFANSLALDNAASSDYALKVMTVVAAVMIPVVLAYQGWTYYVYRARVGGDEPPSSPVAALSREPHRRPPS
jgi:cytochrome bd ubiquinol oxidase subunit II